MSYPGSEVEKLENAIDTNAGLIEKAIDRGVDKIVAAIKGNNGSKVTVEMLMALAPVQRVMIAEELLEGTSHKVTFR